VSAQRACWIAVLVAGSCILTEAKDFALVSYKANTVTTLTIADLAKVCKGQTNRWPDGKPVTCIIRNPNSADMKLLLDKVYSMSKDELLAAIAAANHRRANHPAVIVVESDEDLVKKVESTPGAVGLVDVYAITGGVTVLKVGGKLPLEPGYPLHGN
jgi:ABC-type phosphate transport system substrate-binding protein